MPPARKAIGPSPVHPSCRLLQLPEQLAASSWFIGAALSFAVSDFSPGLRLLVRRTSLDRARRFRCGRSCEVRRPAVSAPVTGPAVVKLARGGCPGRASGPRRERVQSRRASAAGRGCPDLLGRAPRARPRHELRDRPAACPAIASRLQAARHGRRFLFDRRFPRRRLGCRAPPASVLLLAFRVSSPKRPIPFPAATRAGERAASRSIPVFTWLAWLLGTGAAAMMPSTASMIRRVAFDRRIRIASRAAGSS